MVTPLLRRNPLQYPQGRPGVNLNHPASQKLQASCFASGARFLRIDKPVISTFAGTTSTPLIDGILGPSIRCSTTFGAGGETHSFTVASAAGGSPGTLACICRPASTGGNLGVLIAADTPGNAINYFYSNNLVLGNSLGGASTITLTGDEPYFLAWTWPGGATTEYLVATNLRTGKILSASRTSATSGAASVMAVMNAANQAAGMGGPLSHGMYSVKFLTQRQLFAWANDPFSFWYPPTQLETLNWLRGATQAAITKPIGTPMILV